MKCAAFDDCGPDDFGQDDSGLDGFLGGLFGVRMNAPLWLSDHLSAYGRMMLVYYVAIIFRPFGRMMLMPRDHLIAFALLLADDAYVSRSSFDLTVG